LATLFVLQAIVAPTLEIFDDDIDVMMSSGELPPPSRPPPPFRVTQAGPVVMVANPHIKARI
jgi:hypothetical protein